jgi:hypothetical protein
MLLYLTICLTLQIVHDDYIAFMCFYGSQNKQEILPYISLTDWILQPKWRVFTAWYELTPYITHIGLMKKRVEN